jgi:hypothetical protein
MTPSDSPEADWELTEGAVFYAREADAEVGLAFIPTQAQLPERPEVKTGCT